METLAVLACDVAGPSLSKLTSATLTVMQGVYKIHTLQ